MIKLVLLILLACSIRYLRHPWISVMLYGLALYVSILLTSDASFWIILGIVAFQTACAALYAWMLTKLLFYAHLEGAIFWWIALCMGLLIGILH